MVSELDGLTVLDFSLFVPPGLTEEEYIMGATAWYYSNFTETGNPFMVAETEILSISLNGKLINNAESIVHYVNYSILNILQYNLI